MPAIVEGCCVKIANSNKNRWIVYKFIDDNHIVIVRGKERIIVSKKEIVSGYTYGDTVQYIPLFDEEEKDVGRVEGGRTICGMDQVLVHIFDSGKIFWSSFERLKKLKSVESKYQKKYIGNEDVFFHEKFKLKILASIFENWNFVTGSLERLDIDPLPHQIRIAYHVLMTKNDCGWLIADDVGLGKTIEVGMILSAWKRTGKVKRVLIVCPQVLAIQWQEEMKNRFNQDFDIYEKDFHINDFRKWKGYDNVIVSVDTAKSDFHMEKFEFSGKWDVVVFDEAHKLTKEYGRDETQRYTFADFMMKKNGGVGLWLTATPHQGYTDRFKSLLALVRPDLKKQIEKIEENPEIVSDIILRNKKAEVIDMQGNLLFKGHDVTRIIVSNGMAENEFEEKLREYFNKGYGAYNANQGRRRATQLVMTSYRKLASSSMLAIVEALKSRRDKLKDNIMNKGYELGEFLEDDGLSEEEINNSGEFFDDEILDLDRLIEFAENNLLNNSKLDTFINKIANNVFSEDKKMLIFTEYRITQKELEKGLQAKFGSNVKIVLLNGSMNMKEKNESVDKFNTDENVKFLISTEAGGEGLNLQKSCHIMTNYDLPWNPAKIIQRIGRLYRYGQENRVKVFNLISNSNFGNRIVDLMLTKIKNIAYSMSFVGSEYNDGLYIEILGNILENIDIREIIEKKDWFDHRTEEEVTEAIRKAEEARKKQDQIISYMTNNMMEIDYFKDNIWTMSNVGSFMVRMTKFMGDTNCVWLQGRKGCYELKLSDDMVGRFKEFGKKQTIRITTDREIAQKNNDFILIDYESEFLRYMIDYAKSYEFGGQYGYQIFDEDGLWKTIGMYEIRWQNEFGGNIRPESILFEYIKELDEFKINTDSIKKILMDSKSGSKPMNKLECCTENSDIDAIRKHMEDYLNSESGGNKIPNVYFPIAIANVK